MDGNQLSEFAGDLLRIQAESRETALIIGERRGLLRAAQIALEVTADQGAAGYDRIKPVVEAIRDAEKVLAGKSGVSL